MGFRRWHGSLEAGAGLAAAELDPQEAPWSRKSGASCGDSSRVAEARWPSIQAHTQLSRAFLNPPGFSKMTLTWRMEAEAPNSAEPGLQLFASFMGSPRVAVTVLKWGTLASEGCFRFLLTAPIVRKKKKKSLFSYGYTSSCSECEHHTREESVATATDGQRSLATEPAC